MTSIGPLQPAAPSTFNAASGAGKKRRRQHLSTSGKEGTGGASNGQKRPRKIGAGQQKHLRADPTTKEKNAETGQDDSDALTYFDL